MTPLRDDIMEALQAGPLTARQAAEAVGTEYQYALKVLSQLCEKGITRRHGWAKAKRGSATLFERIAA